MDHATRRPMLAAAVLSAALHAVALALVLAQRDQSAQGARQIAVEIAWVQAGRTGNDSGRPTTPASPADSTRGSILGSSPRTPPEPWIAGPSPGEDAERKGADEEADDGAATTVASAPAQHAHGVIKVGADLRSAPARSRNSNQGLASARPSSPAFSRRREKEPEPQRSESFSVRQSRSDSEPSPACGRGQGEGRADCAASAEPGAALPPATSGAASASGANTPALAGAGDVVQRVPPVYPLTARRQGLQGTAMVRARFDAEGRPETVAIVASSGSASLDDAAREAVRRWRFRAGSAGVLDMPITFRLDGRERGAVAAAGG